MNFNNIEFTKSFVRNYRRRIGSFPNKNHLLKLIRGSQRIQKARRLKTLTGENCNTLSMFWNIEKKIVIFVDDLESIPVAVSMVSYIKKKKKHSKKKTMAVQ
ncbi:MAG: hypothetical protein GY714_10590 [Desulfobacterales bacterium]|nr:hypothetical protein [Desulfobacterales bacterium]